MAEGDVDPPSLKIAEFYAGIGGYHYGLKRAGVRGDVIASVDINTNTTSVYVHNFPSTPHLNRNICGLTANELDMLGADVFFLSPPCQPFTRQGNRRDDQDRRTESFFHLMHLINELRLPPSYLLMENVKGFEVSQTRDHFVGILRNREYSIQEFLLNPNQFGIPNSRLRYYLLAKRRPLKFALSFSEGNQGPSVDANKLVRFLSRDPNRGHLEPDVGTEMELDDECQGEEYKVAPDICKPLSNYLEDISVEELSRFLVPDKILQKYVMALDIVRGSSCHSCCFTKAYGNYAVGTGSILQHSLGEEDLKKSFQDFKKLQESNDFEESVKCLRGLNLRYFTPREVANLMCFPSEFSFPAHLTDKQCYKAVGNSLNVAVVSVLMRYLFSDGSQ